MQVKEYQKFLNFRTEKNRSLVIFLVSTKQGAERHLKFETRNLSIGLIVDTMC